MGNDASYKRAINIPNEETTRHHISVADVTKQKILGPSNARFLLWPLGPALSVYIYEYVQEYMSHSQMLGKVECGGGPIFKVVLEC